MRQTPVKRESKHYFFRLSSFEKKLKEWLLSNQNLQPDVKNYVINWINEGLQDSDITRDLSWGVPIPLPEAKGKVSMAGSITTYATSRRLSNSKMIGEVTARDSGMNRKFTILLARILSTTTTSSCRQLRLGINSEYKLPDYIPTRGHLMLQNQKISKSRSWYIGLKDFTSAFNADYLRFYLASVVTYSQDDLNFDFDAFYERINNELIANIGNFINRALSFTQKSFQGIVPEATFRPSVDEPRSLTIW